MTVTGTVRGDPDIYRNRAGDMTTRFDVAISVQPRSMAMSESGVIETIVHIVTDGSLAERVARELTNGAAVVITARGLQVETYYSKDNSSEVRAVVVARDMEIGAR
jgi:single-stranded DNA-binding protein